tara:strand:- start:574 stop:1707 length:1134 start_codon:yes stop_codon:yes gene_type:complete
VLYKKIPYLFKRGSTYYFVRRVPSDILGLYSSSKIVVSLRTKIKRSALLSASHLSLELDSYWSSIRIKEITDRYVKRSVSNSRNISGITLEEAKDYYLELKGTTKPKLFHQIATRNTQYIINEIGNKDLSDYSTIDAGKFRDALLKRGLSTSSVRRIFSSIKSIVNLAIKEKGLSITNPFLGVYIPDLNDVKERKPIPIDEINRIQSECRLVNDELRWIVSIISDTGMRLAETVGLKAEDIVLDSDTPHVLIRPNEKRRLKTKQSERSVPLVGASLWGATQAFNNQSTGYLFKRYNKTEQSNSNSASAALNKWIKSYTQTDIVIHSFRHSLRDRLRAIECPSDIVDSVGGWSKRSVGENYGYGYPIKVLHKWLKRIT